MLGMTKEWTGLGWLRVSAFGLYFLMGGVYAQPMAWIDVHVHLLATDLPGAKALAGDVVDFAQEPRYGEGDAASAASNEPEQFAERPGICDCLG